MSISGRRNVVSVIWTLVGLLLIWRGLPYVGLVEQEGIDGLTGASTWIALALAVVVGIGKGLTALRKGARRAVTYIESQGEEAPGWKVFSPIMYVLVALMIAAGLALRFAPYDPGVKAWVVGILYPGIGVALVIGAQLVRRVAAL